MHMLFVIYSSVLFFCWGSSRFGRRSNFGLPMPMGFEPITCRSQQSVSPTKPRRRSHFIELCGGNARERLAPIEISARDPRPQHRTPNSSMRAFSFLVIQTKYRSSIFVDFLQPKSSFCASFGARPLLMMIAASCCPTSSANPGHFLVSSIARMRTFCSCDLHASAKKDAPA